MPADIEKIERELRDTLTDAETPRGFSWENRYHANPAISSCDRLFIARCSPENIRALLDELSRLREEPTIEMVDDATRYLADALRLRPNELRPVVQAAMESAVRRARALSERSHDGGCHA